MFRQLLRKPRIFDFAQQCLFRGEVDSRITRQVHQQIVQGLPVLTALGHAGGHVAAQAEELAVLLVEQRIAHAVLGFPFRIPCTHQAASRRIIAARRTMLSQYISMPRQGRWRRQLFGVRGWRAMLAIKLS